MDIPIGDVKPNKRHFRKRLLNIDSMAASIERLGQLEEIGLDADMTLIYGARRLAAMKQLGRKTIRAFISSDPSELAKRLEMEQAENEEREPLSTSESIELGMAIESAFARDAAKRMAEKGSEGGTKAGRGRPLNRGAPQRRTPNRGKQTRDAAAKAARMGHTNYTKGKAIVKAAKEDPVNDDLVKELDETKNVARTYRKLQDRRGGRKEAAPRGTMSVRLESAGVRNILSLADDVAKLLSKHPAGWSRIAISQSANALVAEIRRVLEAKPQRSTSE